MVSRTKQDVGISKKEQNLSQAPRKTFSSRNHVQSSLKPSPTTISGESLSIKIKNNTYCKNVKNPTQKEIYGNGLIPGMTSFYDDGGYIGGIKNY
jgi:hypothetical protein